MRPRRLGAHVDGAENPDAARPVGGGIGVGGFDGVNVNAQVVAVGREHDGLVVTGENLAQAVDVLDAGDDELGAEAVEVAVRVEPAGQPAGINRSQLGGYVGNRLTGQRPGHAAQHELQAARAGVDDPGVLQDRVLFGRVLDRFIGGVDGDLHLLRGAALRRRGRLSGICGDRDHGAVARLGDGVARGFGSSRKRRRERCAAVAFESGGKAAQPLRADHARAAASAEQRGRGGRSRNLVRGRVGVGLLGRLAGGGERAAQVGAGVAVGHGKDVDLVERLAVQRDPAGGPLDHPAHLRAAERGDRIGGLGHL